MMIRNKQQFLVNGKALSEKQAIDDRIENVYNEIMEQAYPLVKYSRMRD